MNTTPNTPLSSGLREASDMDENYVSPYLRREPRTLEQAQYDHDCTLVRQVIAELNAKAATAAQRGDDEGADSYHRRAAAVARMFAGVEMRNATEVRRDVRQVVGAAKALVRLNRAAQQTRFSPAIKEHAEEQLDRMIRRMEAMSDE